MSGASHSFVFAGLYTLAGSTVADAAAQFTGRPASGTAAKTAEISEVLFVSAALIFAAMMVLAVITIWGPVRIRRRLARPALILFAGVGFPVTALTLLLTYTLNATGSAKDGVNPMVRVEIKGELWWWRVRYLDGSGSLLFETANEIRIPAGVPVEFVLTSDNVIHSFWVPELGGKLDMVPGHVNRMTVQVHEPGVFQGQCAEYCGAQHAKMRFTVQALAPEAFHQWVTAQSAPALSAGPRLQQGAQLFINACAMCHTVRGTRADGITGPDLTHVASRSSLAAGALPNNVGAIAGWITASQHLKPGNLMPSFDHWSGADVRAVATYLGSLK